MSTAKYQYSRKEANDEEQKGKNSAGDGTDRSVCVHRLASERLGRLAGCGDCGSADRTSSGVRARKEEKW